MRPHVESGFADYLLPLTDNKYNKNQTIMKALFTKITDTLTGQAAQVLFKQYNVKPVRYVDLYKGQYQQWEKFEAHRLPAVLFEWQINHNNNPNANNSTATVVLHLIYEQIRSSSSLFNNSDSLAYFDFVTAVTQLVENLEAEHTGKLQLINEASPNPEAIEQAILLTYQCAYTGKAQDKPSKWVYTDEDSVNIITQGNLNTPL